MPLPLGQLRAGLLQRRCRRLAGGYDVFLTANNECDFGRPGIQYIHYPWAHPLRPPEDLRWFHTRSILRAYNWLCLRIAGFTFEGMSANLTLTNSDWTGAKVRQRHGIDTVTLHPPMMDDAPDRPWSERQNGFVCIGRITPDKRVDTIIDIVSALRHRGHDVHLHVIGAPDGSRRYLARIRSLARAHPEWLVVEEDLSRQQLLARVAEHRYGIHGKLDEHFGMAVMEMVRGGAIVFVPRGGGQVEIVGGDERLVYSDAADAVVKIDRVLRDERLRDQLRGDLEARRHQFAPEVFRRRIRELVAGFSR